jgi:hypothetical protein
MRLPRNQPRLISQTTIFPLSAATLRSQSSLPFPWTPLTGWTYLERYPAQRHHLRIVMKKLTDRAGTNSNPFEAWIRQTSTQAVVFIDIPPGSTFYWSGDDHFQQFRTLIKSQTVFHEVEHKTFPQYGSTVSILVRHENMNSRLSCQ